jgi:hypothetical protein
VVAAAGVRWIAAVLVVVAVAWAWTHHRRTVTEHELAAVATELAGRPVGVHCQGFWSELLDINNRAGEVQFPNGRAPDHMFLTRGVCGRLKHFLGNRSHHNLDCLESIDWTRWSIEADLDDPCARGAFGDVEAINTLAHESMHLRGIADEAQAQCYAIQEDAWTVVKLGGTAAQGEAVAEFVLALQPDLPSEYQSGGCRAGGSLDLWPETSAFPAEDPPVLPPASSSGPQVSS